MSFKHDPWQLKNQKKKDLTYKNVLRACRTDGEIYYLIDDDVRFNADIDICTASVKSYGKIIKLMPKNIQQNVSIQKYALKQCNKIKIYSKQYIIENDYDISNTTEENVDDYDIVYEAVKRDPCMYKYVSKRLQNNREIILQALRNCGYNYVLLSNVLKMDEYKNDYEIIEKAVSVYGMLFEHILESMKMDKHLATLAVRSDGLSLKHMAITLQDDHDVVFTAVKDNGLALEFASERLQNVYEIVDEAIGRNSYKTDCHPFRRDKHEILKREKIALRFASSELRNDKQLGKKAIMNNYLSVRFVCDELKDDYNLMYEIVEKDFEMYPYVSSRLKKDKTLAKLFIKKGQVPLYDMVYMHNKDGDFIVNYNRDGYSLLNDIDKELHSDEELIRMAVSKLGCDLMYADEKFKKNKKVVKLAIKDTPFAYRYIADELKDDIELATLALKGNNGGYVYSLFSSGLKLNPTLATLAIKKKDEMFHCIPEELMENRDFMMSIFGDIHVMFRYIEWIPEHYKTDIEFMRNLLREKNGYACHEIIGNMSDELKDNYELMASAIKKQRSIIKHASKRLKLIFEEEENNKEITNK